MTSNYADDAVAGANWERSGVDFGFARKSCAFLFMFWTSATGLMKQIQPGLVE